MIYSLNGKLKHVENGMFVVECGGVGYQCKSSGTTISCLPPVGETVQVYTTMTFTAENGPDLYGFFDRAEQDCFRMLTGVSGVGPKAALAILSELTPESFALAVAAGDVKALTRAKGVGPKAAQRIVLELGDKVSGDAISKGFGSFGAPAAPTMKGNSGEAIAALVSLGYSNSEAAAAVGKLPQEDSVEDMIKKALRALAMGR